MQQLLCDRHAIFDQYFPCEFFLQCFPPYVRMIVAANAELARPTAVELEDHLIDTITPTVASERDERSQRCKGV